MRLSHRSVAATLALEAKLGAKDRRILVVMLAIVLGIGGGGGISGSRLRVAALLILLLRARPARSYCLIVSSWTTVGSHSSAISDSVSNPTSALQRLDLASTPLTFSVLPLSLRRDDPFLQDLDFTRV